MKDILNGDRYIYLRELDKLNKEEKLKAIWNNIDFINKLLREEKKADKNKENKKKEKTRRIKVPLNFCYDYNDITTDEIIEYTNFYNTIINGHDYIIDIYRTTDNKFYVKIVDITNNNYKEIDFKEFKKKNAQPSLFDFFNI